MKLFCFHRCAVKAAGCGALVALSLGLVSQLHAQVNTSYSTNFNNDTPNSTLDGQDGWTINDTNEPDGVGVIGGYSVNGNDYVASVGGDFITDPTAAPSTSPVYLSHGFTPVGTSYAFDTDFFVTNSTSTYPTTNSFGFTFQNATGRNLFSIDLVPNGATSATATADAVRYSVYTFNPVGLTNTAAQTSTGLGTILGSRYHLTISVNSTANTMQFVITGETPQGVKNATPYYTSSTIALTALDAGSTVASFAATYISGNGTNTPGSNGLFFDNVSAVPEPSTFALLGLCVVGLAARFCRKAKA